LKCGRSGRACGRNHLSTNVSSRGC
jgi:hypothetical protein